MDATEFQGEIAVVQLVVGVVQLVVGVWLTTVATRIASNQEQLMRTQIGNSVTDRMLEIDRMILEHPGVWKRLMDETRRVYSKADASTHYFDPAHSDAEARLRVKAIVYYQLNFFDELFVSISQNARLSKEFEFDDWQTYMRKRLLHPLFREVLEESPDIFGRMLVDFANRVWKQPPTEPLEPRVI